MFTTITIVWTRIRAHLQHLRHDEAGYTSETVLVTALLVALALVVIGVLVTLVTNKVHSIQM